MNEATKDIKNINSFTKEQKANLEAFFYVMDKMKCSPIVSTLKDYVVHDKELLNIMNKAVNNG
jgi:hypothetical protein